MTLAKEFTAMTSLSGQRKAVSSFFLFIKFDIALCWSFEFFLFIILNLNVLTLLVGHFFVLATLIPWRK